MLVGSGDWQWVCRAYSRCSEMVESCQWWLHNPAAPDVPVAIEGATTASYTPTENGIYFVDATGGNLGYNYHAAAEPWKYTTDGVVSMVVSPTITMHSNAIQLQTSKQTAAGVHPAVEYYGVKYCVFGRREAACLLHIGGYCKY